uniref:FBA_2 domain-containing protein n=1 Tax=Steinernema glaseri TaxID=37863 RepID=A0A1I7ZJU6_9BILA
MMAFEGVKFKCNAPSVHSFTHSHTLILLTCGILFSSPFLGIHKMDSVPFAFCEHLCDILSIKELFEVKQLPRSYGDLAGFAHQNRFAYLADNKEQGPLNAFMLPIRGGIRLKTTEEMEAVPRKFVRLVALSLWRAEDVKLSRETVQRFPYAIHRFWLQSAAISEAWVDFACSLKRLGSICTSQNLRSLQRLVDARKLSELDINENACDDDNIGVLKAVLCQDQFQRLKIFTNPKGSWNTNVVRELLHFWTENHEKLRGKNLILVDNCSSEVHQLQEFVLYRSKKILTWSFAEFQTALTQCTEEECEYIGKYYRHRAVLFYKPSCVYKFEEGEGGKRRRLYISFECADEEERRTVKRNLPASHEGCNDLRYMHRTIFCRVLFG